jgi:hypothetical protein
MHYTYHNVSGDVILLAMREQMFKENDRMPLKMTTPIGYGSVYSSGLAAIAVISPVTYDNATHCSNARGAMCPSKSTGCNFNEPVSISPDATTLSAAKTTHAAV